MWETFIARTGLKKDPAWLRFVVQSMAISFVLHLIATVRSAGFYNATEQMQVIELVSYKLGRTPLSELPGDFHLQTVSWLLPVIYRWISGFLSLVGNQNPFDWALGYRAFSSVVGWMGVTGLALCCHAWFADRRWRNWSVILLAVTWYLPWLHARHSAENLSGALFVLGVCCLVLTAPARSRGPQQTPSELPLATAIATGVLFGLSVQLRFHAAAMVVGALIWLTAFARIKPLQLLPLLGGIAFSTGVGALADRWGYGEWTFPLANVARHLFDAPLGPVLRADSHWEYLRAMTVNTWPILGTLLFAGVVTAWVRFPKQILTWCTAPLLILQQALPAKQLSFLFPLAAAAPVLIMLALSSEGFGQKAIDRLLNRTGAARWLPGAAQFLVGLNVIALLFTSTVPAWLPIRLYSHLYKNKSYGFELYYKDQSPYSVSNAQVYFYRPEGLDMKHLTDYTELVDRLKKVERPAWLFLATSKLPDDSGDLKAWCKPDYQLASNWMTKLTSGRSLASQLDWTLFRCQGPDTMKSNLFSEAR